MNLSQLKYILKFLFQFSIGGLAIAFLLLFFYPDKFLPEIEQGIKYNNKSR
jgi:hypothetical protein